MKRVGILLIFGVFLIGLMGNIIAPEQENNDTNSTCTDTDNAEGVYFNFYEKGTVTLTNNGESSNSSDSCCTVSGCNTLTERYCVYDYGIEEWKVHRTYYECPNGCEEGACIGTPNETETEIEIPRCETKDPEKWCVYWYGNDIDIPNPISCDLHGVVYGYVENCVGKYCSGLNQESSRINCPNGCENGICILEENQEDNETETSSDKVCCHKFGYGNQMRVVSSKYQMIEREDCVTPEGFVGGGREIVEGSFCEQYKEQIREKNRIKAHYTNSSECPEDCTCAGSTVKCILEEGTRQMTVYAGKSGNMIIQIKGINMTTNVELYKNENGTLIVKLPNGQEKNLSITPDQIQERIKQRLKNRIIYIEDLKLDENGYYEVQAKKRARLFLIVPVKEKIRTQIDSETGEMIKIRTSWWGFLAKDIQEENTEEDSE